MTDKNKYEILAEIQAKVKCSKDDYNKFGGFNYRNAEAMLTQINPIVKEAGCTLIIDDDLQAIGDRIYIKSTAMLITPDGEIHAHAYAREQLTKKGMDEAQITGSASSYAKKYALQNLFAMSDGRDDPDSKDNSDEGTSEPAVNPQTKITEAQIKTLKAAAAETGTNIDDVVNHFRPGGTIEDFTARQYGEALNILNKKRMRLEAGA